MTEHNTITEQPGRGHGDDGGHDEGKAKPLFDVRFLNLKTNDSARFAVPGHVTLERAWQMAYDELGETRAANDVLETRTGTALASHLGQTIKHIHQHVDSSLRFQIHGEQGGA